ncbi:class I tRNA ligase family protein, partial [Streptomyces sp. GbtcB6]|uniref:class I tRNA ligase family protein n=1 Tax=Streptomyces sp. GbtcB6 TaxID=2824751 RepID=UPI001C2FCE8B
ATNGEEQLVVAEPLDAKALGEGWETTGQTYTGAEMERWTYQRPFVLVEFPEPAHYVVSAEYVTTEDGTGLVLQSPAFGG